MTLLICPDTMNISKMKLEQRIEMGEDGVDAFKSVVVYKHSNSNHFDANDWNCYPMSYPIFRFRRMPYIQHLVRCVMQ